MGALAFEHVLDRDQAVLRAGSVGDAEIVGDVAEQHDVDVFEHSSANVVSLGADQLLGDAGPEADGALQMLALHHLLHGQRGHDVQRHAGVVPFAVSGRAFDHGLMPGHAGFLRRLRNIVDVGAERDDRLALAPGGDPGGGNAGDVAIDLEAFFFENAGEVFGCLEFLEAELAEAEDAVDHDLRLLLHGVDLAGEVGLHGGFFIGGDLGLSQSAGGAEEQRESEFAHSGGVLLPVLFSLSREGGSLGTSSRGSSAVDGWEETNSTQQVGHCRLRRIRD